MTRVTKSWFVEGSRTAPDGKTIERVRSRNFHVFDAATQYAAELRKATDMPESVNVRTRVGNDKLQGDW
jgi:hypothetical protein